MVELETGVLPGAESDSSDDSNFDPEAPYGRKKDGTPAKKRGRQPGSSGVRRSRVNISEAELQEALVDIIGTPFLVVSPLAVSVIDDRSERTARALIRLSSRSPRIAKMVNTFVEGADYKELVLFPVAIAVAVLVDAQRLAPDSMPAKHFKIDDFWNELYEDTKNAYAGNGQGVAQARGLLGELE